MKNNSQKQFLILTLVAILYTLSSCSRNGSKSGCPGELSIQKTIVTVLK